MSDFPTIENDFDRLYRDFPEIYDRLAETEYEDGKIIKRIDEMFNLHGKIVVDVGSGTGLSTMNLAKYAGFVFGVEPEEAMRKVALKKAKKHGFKNVKFLSGMAQKIPLEARSVDAVVAAFSVPPYHPELDKMERLTEEFVCESLRVLRDGGFIVAVCVAPFWYGGELASVILGEARVTEQDHEGKAEKIFKRLDFKHRDIYVVTRFNSLSEAVEVFGFIFGRKAINHLIMHKKTSIKWKFRLYYRRTA